MKTPTLVIALFLMVLSGSPVNAGDEYPRKSHFTKDVYYGCVRTGDEANTYELDFKRNNTYRDRLSGNEGRFTYNRNRGRLDFQGGPVNRFFLKVISHGGGIYEYKLKRQRDRSLWGECHPNPS